MLRELRNCRFAPLQAVERLNELLNLADIHLLPQRGGAFDLVMPSKLTGMFASGRVVIAMARPGTELHNVVAPLGAVVLPKNVDAPSAPIEALVADPEQRAILGAAGPRVWRAAFVTGLGARAARREVAFTWRLARG